MILEQKYEGRTYTVEFTSGHPYRRYHVGKSFPKTTQCIVKKNGLVIGVGQVVKHHKDEDNPEYARRAAAKKAFKGILWKELRKRFWVQINSIELPKF